MNDNISFEIFKKEVDEGLSGNTKSLPSKYFYDDRGSLLFQQIMNLPEYYLTSCEHEIFEDHKERIASQVKMDGQTLDLIELGAGDGTKTQILLTHMLNKNIRFRYLPVDISSESNARLHRRLKSVLPKLEIETISTEYFDALNDLRNTSRNPKLVLFLGSNIGNFSPGESRAFFKTLSETLDKGDLLICGFDLKKGPDQILAAYNDESGVTREFNLNLLHRLNRELDADFVVENFDHYPVYDPDTGAAKSYLISRKKQKVHIKALNKTFLFDEWEPLFTEISQKFDFAMINDMAERNGFSVKDNFIHDKSLFVDSLWECTG